MNDATPSPGSPGTDPSLEDTQDVTAAAAEVVHHPGEGSPSVAEVEAASLAAVEAARIAGENESAKSAQSADPPLPVLARKFADGARVRILNSNTGITGEFGHVAGYVDGVCQVKLISPCYGGAVLPFPEQELTAADA